MTTWEHRCGNCGAVYDVDSEGNRIQPCPECGSNEMIKGL